MDHFNLSYAKLAFLEASIDQFADLVAIFCRENSEELLQVYNLPYLPPSTQPGIQQITLPEMLEKDLASWDGLWVGFSALDGLREDLCGLGHRFYPIQKLFQNSNQPSLLTGTTHHLIRFLEDQAVRQGGGQLPPNHSRLVLRISELRREVAPEDESVRKYRLLPPELLSIIPDELEDLVAICSHSDPNHGCLYVYRVLGAKPGGLSFGSSMPLDIFLAQGIPPGYSSDLYTFSAIYSCLPEKKGIRFHELGELLWKLEEGYTLGRTLWLTARDMLHHHYHRENLALLHHIFQMSLRACQIYSLSDPWGWRGGNWGSCLRGIYATLQETLSLMAEQSRETSRSYYQALAGWFSCFGSEDVKNTLQEMLRQIRQFLHETREGEKARPEEDVSLAKCLLEIGERVLLQPLTSEPALQWEALPERQESFFLLARQSLEQAACGKADFLSPTLMQFLACLLSDRQQREKIYSQERDIDRLVQQLVQYKSRIKRYQKSLYSTGHEMKILQLASQLEISRLDEQLYDLESAAKLNIKLSTYSLYIYEAQTLSLEVFNRGRVAAEDLVFTLVQPRGVQLLDTSPTREVVSLPRNEARTINFRIRPLQQNAEIRLEFTFRDQFGQLHSDSWGSQLPVHSLDQEAFNIKVNYYQFGLPVQNPADFYGRRMEIQNILSLLKAGGKQNVVLRGPRRMGKTSLLYMLRSALNSADTRRLFEIPEEWDMALERVHPVFVSLHAFDLEKGEVTVRQFFRTLLERFGEVLEISELESDALVEQFKIRENEIGAVNAALGQVKKLLDSHPGEHITVLLDEYDEIYRPQGGSLDRSLREFVSAEQRVTWIIASTLALFREIKSVSSPWFNVFNIMELGCLQPESAVQLVESPSRGEKVYWYSDAVLRLLEETGRHPAFTQLFCARLIAHLNQIQSNYVLLDTISTVAEQLVDQQEIGQSHFEFYWSDTSGVGRMILLIIDGQSLPMKRDELRRRVLSRLKELFGERPARRITNTSGYWIEWQEQEFKDGMEWVEKILNAISPDSQRRYIFTVPLFQRWLRRIRLQVDLEADVNEKIVEEMEHDGI